MIKIFNIIFKYIALAVIGYFIYLGLQKADQFLLSKAVYECGQISSVSYETEDGATITQPFQSAYEQCLQDKNIK